MKMNRLAGVMAVAGIFFLSAAPGLTSALDPEPAAVQPRRMASPAARPTHDPSSTADFAGLKFTDDQKSRIDEIHRRMSMRKDVVIKSEKLNADQKDAMMAGLGRMERGAIIKLLTPEQQREVLKKVRTAQAGTQEEKKQSQPR
jgi:hypothetical protein